MKNLAKFLLTAAVFLSSCTSVRLPQTNEDYAKTSAMITLDTKKSGGSGVILKSTPNESFVLTNLHVCQLIQAGGSVTTAQGTYPVYSFRTYKRHDLCLVRVLANLHQNNKLAENAPLTYSEVTVSGHPLLMPTMITKGVFADKMVIQLMVDTIPCDGSEDAMEAFMCIMTGEKPVIKTYEAQPITATIMSGSSGSGVFNDKGEVSGLVFAGSEGLSYGFIVPFVYLKDFLTNINSYPEQFPNSNGPRKSFFASFFKMHDACSNHLDECKHISFQSIYSE